ncbi:hypothetical protein H8959_011140 [Pygathrix nigripes]
MRGRAGGAEDGAHAIGALPSAPANERRGRLGGGTESAFKLQTPHVRGRTQAPSGTARAPQSWGSGLGPGRGSLAAAGEAGGLGVAVAGVLGMLAEGARWASAAERVPLPRPVYSAGGSDPGALESPPAGAYLQVAGAWRPTACRPEYWFQPRAADRRAGGWGGRQGEAEDVAAPPARPGGAAAPCARGLWRPGLGSPGPETPRRPGVPGREAFGHSRFLGLAGRLRSGDGGALQ